MKTGMVALGMLSLGAVACGSGGRTAAQPEKAAATGAPTIEVVRVVEQSVKVDLSLPGELDPYEVVAIYPKVTGFVKAIRVDRGSRVRAGELIAQLDAPELEAQRSEAQSRVQAAEAQLASARSKADADVSTYEKLKAASATPGVVAGNDVVLAQKAVESQQGQIAAAQQNIEAARQALRSVTQMEGYLNVIAPFDGVVTERNVHPGALVGPASGSGAGIPIVRIVQNSRLRLVVPVPQAYLAAVTNGTVVPFTVSGYPGEKFAGTVARMARSVDVKTRTMAVELEVSNRDERLANGMFCQVQWSVRRPGPSLLVPTGSVARSTDRSFVVRVRNGRTEWVDVSTGLASGPLVEVFGHLQAGDTIATRGTDELRAGTEVRVREAKPAAP
jgi:membrane fusion protein (multidrug efflux system)